eukprot:GHVR01025500.1.p1 GENE.GHVR01025500.1~~GHVR01025500.1.p1  ORF type:complete len:293 (-),score=56.48 GHVR01025500.1:25-903(-)
MSRIPRVFVGNLPEDVREREIEDLFTKYGKIRDVTIKRDRNRDGTAFAFVDFDDIRDAEDAVRGRDGVRFDSHRLRVEMQGRPGGTGGGYKGGRDGRDSNKHPNAGPPQRSDHRVVVTDLPPSASWQDLKDHMRQAGQVGFADLIGRGVGVVEYSCREDLERALSTLQNTDFKNPWDATRIRVVEERDYYAGRRDSRRSRSRSRKRDRRNSSPCDRKDDRKDDRKGERKSSPGRHSRRHSRANSRAQSRTHSRTHSPSPSRSPPPRRKASSSRGRSASPVRPAREPLSDTGA